MTWKSIVFRLVSWSVCLLVAYLLLRWQVFRYYLWSYGMYTCFYYFPLCERWVQLFWEERYILVWTMLPLLAAYSVLRYLDFLHMKGMIMVIFGYRWNWQLIFDRSISLFLPRRFRIWSILICLCCLSSVDALFILCHAEVVININLLCFLYGGRSFKPCAVCDIMIWLSVDLTMVVI